MSGLEIGLLSILAILVLIYAGMHIAIALCLVSLVALWAIKGSFPFAMNLLSLAAYDSVAGYVFGVVPLFVLMGFLVSVAGIGRDTFWAADTLLRRVKGGLGLATVGANAVFAAVTGISVASAAVFTKVAVPEMLRAGYTPRFAVGVVAGSSVLGMLIPPSLLMIIFGLITEQSIGDLFIAGVVPGLLLAASFGVMILLYAYLLPSRVQPNPVQAEARDESAGLAIVRLLPVAVLILLGFGGIYVGWFTPTEAGAVGALGAFLIAAWRRQITLPIFWKILVETGHVTVSIMFLIIAANIYSRLLAFSGLPLALETWVKSAGLGFYPLLILYSAIILFLGTLMDGVSIMLIMVPMFLPLVAKYSVNLIWFGIVTVIAVEVGLLTPPFGLSVFVIKSTLNDARISLGDIFAGAFPYVIVMCLVLLAVIFYPPIALVLLQK
ncbi:MAG TPA: TRAP transporter large permease [Burkholderiales bacterium]